MAGFDPNQPRDEEGMWTIAGSAARKAAGLASSDMDPEFVIWWNKIEKLAPVIADDPLEHLYILDKDGNVLEKVGGGENSIQTTEEQDSLANGNILFHNHPYDPNDPFDRKDGLSYARFSNGDLIYTFNNRSYASAVVSGDYLIGIQFPADTMRNLLSEYRGYSEYVVIELLQGKVENFVVSKVAGTLASGNKKDVETFLAGNYVVGSTDILDAMAEGYKEQGIKFWWKKWR